MRAKISEFYINKPHFSFTAWAILAVALLVVYLSAIIFMVADFIIYADL